MIKPEAFLSKLKEEKINFFAGVPDSLMQGFLTCLQHNVPENFIAADEGAAVAMAAGYYLATNKIGLVYLQNSGLGNCINPLTSLVNEEVYGIPMLLLIGWRGQPGKKDEPQHQKMGAITLSLLQNLGISYYILSTKGEENWSRQIEEASLKTKQISHPVALVVEEGFFETESLDDQETYELSAEEVIASLYSTLQDSDVIICTTGKIGRIFYQVNQKHGKRIRKYFLNVGAMGHTSAIAAALSRYTQGRVIVLDGDGALLMHLGSLAVNRGISSSRFVHIILNNGAHQSVGGQPTVGFTIDFCIMAKACGYENIVCISKAESLRQHLEEPLPEKSFIEIRINTKMADILPRPQEDFKTAKIELIQALNSI